MSERALLSLNIYRNMSDIPLRNRSQIPGVNERYEVCLSLMTWNWEKPDWPKFYWNDARLALAEREFLLAGGMLAGTVKHLSDEEREQLIVDSMSTEAVTTSKIEGEVLDRASVQSSIRRQLGLAADKRNVQPAEQGVAEMMVDLYRSLAAPLHEETLFGWHRMLMSGRRDLTDVGRYRTDEE